METNEIPMPPLPEEEVEQEVTEQIEQEEVDQPTEQPEEQPEKETPQQTNFRSLRLEKERLERENSEYLRELQEYKKPALKKPPEEEDLEINLGDDDLFEGKHYKKIQKQLKKQQEALDRYESQAKLNTAESRLKSQYVDFDKVVNETTIKRLRESEPELADTIASNPDIYNKAVSAYKMIKKLGIYVEDNFENERQIAQRNSLKPKPLASVAAQQGDSPLTKANAFANGLTPELQRQLWREMEESSKEY